MPGGDWNADAINVLHGNQNAVADILNCDWWSWMTLKQATGIPNSIEAFGRRSEEGGQSFLQWTRFSVVLLWVQTVDNYSNTLKKIDVLETATLPVCLYHSLIYSWRKSEVKIHRPFSNTGPCQHLTDKWQAQLRRGSLSYMMLVGHSVYRTICSDFVCHKYPLGSSSNCMTNIIDPVSQKSHLHQQMHSQGNTTRVQKLHSEHAAAAVIVLLTLFMELYT